MVQALMTDPKLEAPKPHGYCEKCSTASETVCHFYPDMCPDRAAIEPSPEPSAKEAADKLCFDLDHQGALWASISTSDAIAQALTDYRAAGVRDERERWEKYAESWPSSIPRPPGGSDDE